MPQDAQTINQALLKDQMILMTQIQRRIELSLAALATGAVQDDANGRLKQILEKQLENAKAKLEASKSVDSTPMTPREKEEWQKFYKSILQLAIVRDGYNADDIETIKKASHEVTIAYQHVTEPLSEEIQKAHNEAIQRVVVILKRMILSKEAIVLSRPKDELILQYEKRLKALTATQGSCLSETEQSECRRILNELGEAHNLVEQLNDDDKQAIRTSLLVNGFTIDVTNIQPVSSEKQTEVKSNVPQIIRDDKGRALISISHDKNGTMHIRCGKQEVQQFADANFKLKLEEILAPKKGADSVVKAENIKNIIRMMQDTFHNCTIESVERDSDKALVKIKIKDKNGKEIANIKQKEDGAWDIVTAKDPSRQFVSIAEWHKAVMQAAAVAINEVHPTTRANKPSVCQVRTRQQDCAKNVIADLMTENVIDIHAKVLAKKLDDRRVAFISTAKEISTLIEDVEGKQLLANKYQAILNAGYIPDFTQSTLIRSFSNFCCQHKKNFEILTSDPNLAIEQYKALMSHHLSVKITPQIIQAIRNFKGPLEITFTNIIDSTQAPLLAQQIKQIEELNKLTGNKIIYKFEQGAREVMQSPAAMSTLPSAWDVEVNARLLELKNTIATLSYENYRPDSVFKMRTKDKKELRTNQIQEIVAASAQLTNGKSIVQLSAALVKITNDIKQERNLFSSALEGKIYEIQKQLVLIQKMYKAVEIAKPSTTPALAVRSPIRSPIVRLQNVPPTGVRVDAAAAKQTPVVVVPPLPRTPAPALPSSAKLPLDASGIASMTEVPKEVGSKETPQAPLTPLAASLAVLHRGKVPTGGRLPPPPHLGAPNKK